jgi:hypothetical protein
MRRAIAKWGLVFSLVLTLALGLIWVDSLLLQTFSEPLSLGPGGYLRVEDGRLYLFSELGDDWKPNSIVPDRRARSWVRRYMTWFFPGIEYHNRLFASGRTIWSLEVALVIPVACSLSMAAILWRLRRRNNHAGEPMPAPL